MVKHIPHALSVAVIGFVATYASTHPSVGFILWPALVGWACYLLGGATHSHGLRTLANMVFGGLLSVGILKLGTYISADFGAFAFPTAVA